MYDISRNDYYKNTKKSSIVTPSGVSKYLFELLSNMYEKSDIVLDPCVGYGSLLYDWKNEGFKTIAIDIEDTGYENLYCCNYLAITDWKLYIPSIVIMNPPFNIDDNNREYIKEYHKGRPLIPELFLSKTLELFGKDIPIVLFVPVGFRLNQKINSKRLLKFTSNIYPSITSIISLPLNIFNGVAFHSEILLFNIKNIDAHYFYSCI